MKIQHVIKSMDDIMRDQATVANDMKTCHVVILSNILTEDDFEDEGCMEESLEDIRILASQNQLC